MHIEFGYLGNLQDLIVMFQNIFTPGDIDVALLGKGGCRGGGWQENNWPKTKGFASVDDCGRQYYHFLYYVFNLVILYL